jgi:hypothetical protein
VPGVILKYPRQVSIGASALLALLDPKIGRMRFCQLGFGLDAPSAVINSGSFDSSGIGRLSYARNL